MIGLVIGVLALLWGSTGLAQSGLFSMSQIWNLPGPERPNYVSRLGRSFGFLAVLGLGIVVTTALASFGTFGRHNIGLGVLAEVLAVAVNIATYFGAFRVLTPKVVQSRKLIPGAILGGVLWTVLQAVGGYLIGHDLKNDSVTYGVFAVVLGLVAWIYLGCELTIYAAELNTVLARRLWPRGMVQPPLTEADQRSLALQATQNQRRPEQEVSVSFTRSGRCPNTNGCPPGRTPHGRESRKPARVPSPRSPTRRRAIERAVDGYGDGNDRPDRRRTTKASRGIAGGVAPGRRWLGHHLHRRGAVPGGRVHDQRRQPGRGGRGPCSGTSGHGLRGDTPAGGRLRHFAVGRETTCRTGRLDPPALSCEPGSAIRVVRQSVG